MENIQNIQDFAEEVRSKIKSFLSEDYDDAAIEIVSITKSNDRHFVGIVARANDAEHGSMSPTVYLEPFFKEFLAGRSMQSILSDIAHIIEANSGGTLDTFDFNDLNFETIKNQIAARLCEWRENKDFLADKPYSKLCDLAVYYAVNVGENENGHLSFTIDNKFLDHLGVTKDEVHAAALSNLRCQGVVCMSLAEVLAQMMDVDISSVPEPGLPMHIITNHQRLFGAAALIDNKFLETLAREFGCDFVILPSSVHEIIAIPVGELPDLDVSMLKEMVQSVNATEVAPSERLSNSVYMFDATEMLLKRLDDDEDTTDDEGAWPW